MSQNYPDTPLTLGILGSGQLGRMIALSAAQMGIAAHIYAPDASDSPAGQVAHHITQAAYDDNQALTTFGKSVDAVVSEFENMPAPSLDLLAKSVPVCPGAKALQTAQNRLAEKQMAHDVGMDVPRYYAIRSADELAAALSDLNADAILKTTELGYDGKGQLRLGAQSDAHEAWEALNTGEAILEEKISFTSEISFLIGRSLAGDICHFPASENRHENGILAHTLAPAPLPDTIVAEGQRLAEKMVDALGLTGVLAIEMFVASDGRLLFNEMAPRPHNSYHSTIEGCTTSQFEQLVRIALGLPFGSTRMQGKWEMQNILGQHMDQIAPALNEAGAHIHLYGKASARTDRKMGHITRQL